MWFEQVDDWVPNEWLNVEVSLWERLTIHVEGDGGEKRRRQVGVRGLTDKSSTEVIPGKLRHHEEIIHFRKLLHFHVEIKGGGGLPPGDHGERRPSPRSTGKAQGIPFE